MSVSSLPEWKQLLLEKKRREEEERERREKEEEEKFASMPAWKRGIIQRRKAKQESLGDRERERDGCLLQVDVRSTSDGLSDTDSSVTVNLGSELSFSPDPGQWLDADPKSVSQVSVETIVPVHENPFILTQSAWRKVRDSEVVNEPEVKERDKLSPKSQDGELGRGRDIELKKERFRDRSEGREKDRSRDRSQGRDRENSREGCEKDKSQLKELVKDAVREQEFLKVRKDTEEKETPSPASSLSPIGPCLRTIRADNIIIIEQDKKGSDERRGRWREAEREKMEEDYQGKKGVKMDLREILAGGGSVTEIRASEVLIIKPSASPEERSAGGKGREDGDMKGSMDARRESIGRELRTDVSWLREKERPWGQATVINKDSRKDSLDDNVFVERGGRVSQLLSKFGEHPKPPSRSKSSDNFLEPGRRKYSGDQDEQQSEERKADGKNTLLKGVPKRSFSFSDRVICAKENGIGEGEGFYERKMRERIYSERSVALWVDITSSGKETTAKMGCARLLEKDKFAKHRIKTEDEKVRRNESEMCIQLKKVEAVDKRAAEKVGDADGDVGFTVASVKNTEGISFARRVPIRQDGKARADREVMQLTGEKSLERELNVDKDSEAGGETEVKVCEKTDTSSKGGLESTSEASHVAAALDAESHCRHDSAFTECSGLGSTVPDRALHKGAEWSGARPQGPYLTQSVFSPHAEDLLSKIEKIVDTSSYNNEIGERALKAAQEKTKEDAQPGGSENLSHDLTPRSPKRSAPSGIPPGPVEIQIPRTVFYVAEEMEKKKTGGQCTKGQDWEGGQGVERRDSWRIGKPLSRIESLREKIRQRELEKQRQSEGSEAAEISDTQTVGDRYEERGTEIEKQWEATGHVQKRPSETEQGQEEAAAQTSVTAFDVTQEVGVLKTCPQLPVSVPLSQAVRREEVTSKYTTAASEATSEGLQISEDEDDPLKHVEAQQRCHGARHESTEEEQEEEGKELSEEEAEEYTSALDFAQSLSPSPPLPNSLAAMSRIYNLETVGSRSGLYLRERTVDISSSVHLVKVKPIISNSQQGDSKALAGDDICGVQTIQQQIEQFQLKEQEALKSSSNTSLKDRETKGQQSPRGVLKQQKKGDDRSQLIKDDLKAHQIKDDIKAQEKDQETPDPNPRVSPDRVCSPTPQGKQTITITPSYLRSQSPDHSKRATDCAPTPASSPSSTSPAQSPSVSPSPTAMPVLFSIRSASGGQVKRGTTMTITPKKSSIGGTAGSTARPAVSVSTPAKTPAQQTQTVSSSAKSPLQQQTQTVSSSAKSPLQQQTQAAPAVAELGKKKYPTVEEIEVIGGYQNLEKSCLVKNRGTPKRGKVCFSEVEQVCEYPSEASMQAFKPHSQDLGSVERLQGEEVQEEQGDAEGGAVVVKNMKSMGTATGPRIKVDESCPR
ncbi:uncharacterized protein ppp1r18 isoform X2 [Archocentrus centrarchus]|uniref:uncharacterized protein ppp1r18 isoform X2 n=1 Tax=Archocentrus centrarchus TaxID=63155 RepID=UPI0011EA3991|nr:uncharacterized protein LOC115788073 isoform X2 [Archocentrus centrarchus]